jgi:hypothetical protein
MKTKFFHLVTLVMCTFAFALITGCEGPAGPVGPAGVDGKDGIDGVNGSDGTAGVDGDAVCLKCHNLGKKAEITMAYDSSTHAVSNLMYTGQTVYEYAGGRVGCGRCHSDQGFIETQYTGLDTLEHVLGLPQAIQCSTCHSFHNSLDFTNEPNSALRTYDAVELLMVRANDPLATPVLVDFKDASNLCANCHQPRTIAPDPALTTFDITSKYYGPHYGTQSTSLAGIQAYEIGTGYPNPGTGSTHVTDATCITCHMYNKEHNWVPSLEACNTSACHGGSITTISDNSRQVAFQTKLDNLKSKLVTAGIMDATDHAIPGTYTNLDEVGALYNYKWLIADRSRGVHNFLYLETMLDNSIAIFP